jgi:NADPH2:quinone reductase
MAQSIVFEAPGKAVLVEQALPSPGPGQVRIEVEVSLISAGTERSLLTKSPVYPITPGYSLVGRITEVGPQVPRFAVGDRVVAHVAHASEAVCDHRFVLPIGEAVKAEDAAFFAVGAMAIYTVRLARLRMGDPMLIIGQGLIGLIATQVARMVGAAPLTVVDTDLARLDLARRFGADRGFLAQDEPALRAWLQTLPGGGPAATVELAGFGGAVDLAMDVTRRRGRVVAGSMSPTGHSVNVYGRGWLAGVELVGAYFNSRPWQLATTETTSPLDWPVRPIEGGDYQESETDTGAGDIALFLRLLGLGRFDLQPIIGESVQARDAVALFNRLPQSTSLGHLIHWR